MISRAPVLCMRINVAKEDVYLSRRLAVEVRRVKCVFPRNEVQKEIYKSIRNDANYSAEEMKKKVVKEFQDQYLLKVIM